MNESNDTDFLNRPIIWIEDRMVSLLDGVAMFLFWVGALLLIPGMLFWGQLFGGCVSVSWQYCDRDMIDIFFDGISIVLWFWFGAVTAVFWKMILVGVTGRGQSTINNG